MPWHATFTEIVKQMTMLKSEAKKEVQIGINSGKISESNMTKKAAVKKMSMLEYVFVNILNLSLTGY
jgi:hypothetical protein